MNFYRIVIILTLSLTPVLAVADETCPEKVAIEKYGRKDVYRDMPFQPGELATYRVSFAGVQAGTGTIGVRNPTKVDGVYHRQFYAEAQTSEWYEKLFVLKDKIVAKSQPWDFGARDFYIEQNEGAILSKPYQRKKWITFDQENCASKERVLKDAKESSEEFFLERGANDALSAFFHLRTRTFLFDKNNLGKKETIRVYTSEKNWTLEATPLAKETITVEAGKFETVKLKLQTFLGEELQQKGDIFMWIATQEAAKPMIQIEAQVKVGAFWIELTKFTAGKPL